MMLGMHPPRRFWRISKWVGTFFCSILASLWILSVPITNRGQLRIEWVWGSGATILAGGTVILDRYSPGQSYPRSAKADWILPRYPQSDLSSRLRFASDNFGFRWPARWVNTRLGTKWVIPLWLPIAAIGVPTGVQWAIRTTHRRRQLRGDRIRVVQEKSPRQTGIFVAVVTFACALLALPVGFVFACLSVSNHYPDEYLRDVLGLSEDMTWALLIVMWIAASYAVARLAYRLLRWRVRYVRSIECSTCGYDLTGNITGICPECGAAIQVGSLTGH